MQHENTLHTIHFHPYYNSKQFCAPSTSPSYNSKHLCAPSTSSSYNSVHKGKKQKKIGAQQAYNRRTIVCAPYMFNFFHRGALHVQFTYNRGRISGFSIRQERRDLFHLKVEALEYLYMLSKPWPPQALNVKLWYGN